MSRMQVESFLYLPEVHWRSYNARLLSRTLYTLEPNTHLYPRHSPFNRLIVIDRGANSNCPL